MTYYNLKINDKISSTVANSRQAAVDDFAKQTGRDLVLKTEVGSSYFCHLMDEWEDGPHWVDPHIDVFEKKP